MRGYQGSCKHSMYARGLLSSYRVRCAGALAAGRINAPLPGKLRRSGGRPRRSPCSAAPRAGHTHRHRPCRFRRKGGRWQPHGRCLGPSPPRQAGRPPHSRCPTRCTWPSSSRPAQPGRKQRSGCMPPRKRCKFRYMRHKFHVTSFSPTRKSRRTGGTGDPRAAPGQRDNLQRAASSLVTVNFPSILSATNCTLSPTWTFSSTAGS